MTTFKAELGRVPDGYNLSVVASDGTVLIDQYEEHRIAVEFVEQINALPALIEFARSTRDASRTGTGVSLHQYAEMCQAIDAIDATQAAE